MKALQRIPHSVGALSCLLRSISFIVVLLIIAGENNDHYNRDAANDGFATQEPKSCERHRS